MAKSKNHIFCFLLPICRYFDLGEVNARNYIIVCHKDCGQRDEDETFKTAHNAVLSSEMNERIKSVCGDRGNGIFLTVAEKKPLNHEIYFAHISKVNL